MKNVQKTLVAALIVLPLVFLSGCNRGFGFAPYAFDVALRPAPLGWEVDDQGKITVPGHILIFNSKAGAVGATIEGYELNYLDASGNPVFPGDSTQYSKGSLNVRVPPGIRCPAFEEGSVDECTSNTPGAVFTRGDPTESEATFLLPVDIIRELIALQGLGGAVGARAVVTFYGTDDLQRGFQSKPYEWAISNPVGS